MARTPLLRAFTRFAEEHSSAERLGISPAELRGQRQEPGVNLGNATRPRTAPSRPRSTRLIGFPGA